MKVKIVKDASAENNSKINISRFIGKVFEATITRYGADIDFGEELGNMTVFKGEYEIVEE